MSDVSLNIRGRDDGAGAVVDSLREKVKALGDAATKTNSVRGVVAESYDSKRDSIRNDYEQIRSANKRDYLSDQKRFESGSISGKEWERAQKEFKESSKELDSSERAEQNALMIEQNETLREILDEFRNQANVDEKKAQEDSEEFKRNTSGSSGRGGISGFFGFGSRGDDGNPTDPDDPDHPSKKDSDGNLIGGLRNTASSAARGDLMGTVGSAGSMVGGLGTAGSIVAGGAIVAMIVGLFAQQSEKIQEAIAPTSSMRGAGSNLSFKEGIPRANQLSEMGLDGEKFADLINKKAQASKNLNGDLMSRTMDDFAFNKGFGASVDGFSPFERFGGKNSTDVGLDILNVLTSIEESSLKSGDLSSLSEKLKSQETIMTIQREKRDVVNTESSLRTLAAFEKIGLSGKGERGASFLQATIDGLGEGGNENVMMLKYEAAKRAHPELNGDPAALRNFVKYEGDDTKYIKESFQMMKQMSGNSKLAQDDLIRGWFPNANKKDMEMYRKAMNGDNSFFETLSGGGINTQNSFNKGQMYSDAAASTGQLTETAMEFMNKITDLSAQFESFMTTATNWFRNPFTSQRNPPAPRR